MAMACHETPERAVRNQSCQWSATTNVARLSFGAVAAAILSTEIVQANCQHNQYTVLSIGPHIWRWGSCRQHTAAVRVKGSRIQPVFQWLHIDKLTNLH